MAKANIPSTAASPGSSSRIPALDGWRGIAILLVLLAHSEYLLHPFLSHVQLESLGQHGVGLFFVLSGFLITTRLIGEKERRGKIDLRNFYLRRLFRLMPAAWVYLATVMFLLISTRSPHPLAASQLIPSLFFFRNYVDLSGSCGSTAHFWTLSIEEQFYLIWPSLLILVGIKRAKWVSIAGAVAIAVWRFHMLPPIAQLQNFIGRETQYQADSLLIGCAAALLLPTIRRIHPKMAYPLFLGFMTLCSIATYATPLYESSITAVLIAITSDTTNLSLKFLRWSPLVFLGRISYSVYLWNGIFMLQIHSYLSQLEALVLVPAFSLISYYFIEQSGVQLGARLMKRKAASQRSTDSSTTTAPSVSGA